jgi:hypothetical protein
VINYAAMSTRFLVALAGLTAAPVPAQLAAPTKGRSLDHIGFEVANMDLFAQKLQAQGIEFDMPPRTALNGTTKIAFLTDPWGTYIELTQGLAPAK